LCRLDATATVGQGQYKKIGSYANRFCEDYMAIGCCTLGL